MVTNPRYQCCIFNTINLCRPNLNPSLQMHHTKSAQVIALLREVAVSVWRVPPPAPASHSSSLSSVASGGELANRMGLVSDVGNTDLMSSPWPVRAAYRLPVRGVFFMGAGML